MTYRYAQAPIKKLFFLIDSFFSYYGDVGHGHERIALNSAFLSHVPKFDGYIVVSHEAFLSTHEIHICRVVQSF